MSRPPRPPASKLLDRESLRFIVISGSVKAAVGIGFLGLLPALGYALEETRTAVFLYESIMQIAFIYPCRRISVVLPLSNIWIHWAVGFGVALQLLTVLMPPLRTMLGLVPLGADLFFAVTVAVALTWGVALLVSGNGMNAKRVR
jgi:Ca2+-transporting ATPase